MTYNQCTSTWYDLSNYSTIINRGARKIFISRSIFLMVDKQKRQRRKKDSFVFTNNIINNGMMSNCNIDTETNDS